MNKGFDKETFKRSVVDNVKNMFRRTIDEATPQQVFQAVAYAVKDVIIDEWIATHKEYEKKDVKTVYYLSMEFLMGRALGNNIINIIDIKNGDSSIEQIFLVSVCIIDKNRLSVHVGKYEVNFFQFIGIERNRAVLV